MSTSVDVFGPLFLSYRHNDGADIVAELAWLLRAAGIPVWRDQDDLPPGDTAERLRQAIGGGLSGATLVITDDVTNSAIVRSIEAPQLIDLHRNDSRFQLLIANDVAKETGSLDYEAPDRALGRDKDDLKGVDQSATSTDGLLTLTRKALTHRMVQQRATVEASGVFNLTIQTRNVGQVYDRTGAQLDIRIRRSQHEKLPDPAGLGDLRRTLALLADAVTSTGARTVRVGGGAHLSVAFALGIALPSSRIGQLDVVDQRSLVWASAAEAAVPAASSLLFDVTESTVSPAPSVRPRVAVYVDLLPTQSDSAFERYLEEYGHTLAAHGTIRSPQRGLLNSADAGALASEAAGLIRQLSAAYSNARVDVLLAVPFGIAVLIGRLSNTLRVRLFEWDDSDEPTDDSSDARPRYVPSLEVRAGGTAGPIAQVLLDSCTT
ncbi:SAVED domain-containing protein [Frigoribacterium sp. CFBP 8759]|uniref:SAVED domain-containing protein n=1 Tax=Frigoribacterium sp. CFBP 8759 TaxID=2775283 RepID=UPI001781B921|nr:SAVED domain-containing protein [Frigoribacterium sp. CFBP 8759]